MSSVPIISSAARTVSGNSAAITVPRGKSFVNVLVNVTAASGTTPNMALTLEWSIDGTTWIKADPADTFTAITSVTSAAKRVDVKGDYVRLVWTVTGTTPSFTFAADLAFIGG